MIRPGHLGFALTGLVAVLICVWRLAVGDALTGALEARLLDLRFVLRGALPPPATVAVVAIDEAAAAAIGPGAPMRLAVAEAVSRLDEAGAAAIAIDLLLVGATGADAALANSLARTQRAVLGVAAARDLAATTQLSPDIRRAMARSAFRVVADSETGAVAHETPAFIAPPRSLASAALLGHVNTGRSADRVARRLPLAVDFGEGDVLPALSVAAVRLALEVPPERLVLWRGRGVGIGDLFVPTDSSGALVLDHAGPAGTVLTIPLGMLLEGETLAPGLAEQLAGRAVFIGASAESLGDIVATPFGPDVPGVETLAAAAAALFAGGGIRTGLLPAAVTVALALAAALLARAAALLDDVAHAVCATLAVWAAAVAALQLAFVAWAWWLDATAVLAALLAASTGAWILGRRRDRIAALAHAEAHGRLAPHVSPLVSAVERLDRTASRVIVAAVVFVDVEDATGIAEDRAPDDVAALFAAVQKRVWTVAEAHGGVVVEVLGDGALVVFGVEPTAETPAAAALAFGTEIVDATPSGEGIRLRATGHFGPVALADFGGAGRRHLTVTGDTVNVAARLQDPAKRFGVRLLASRVLVEAADGSETFVPLGLESLRGRREPVEIWARKVEWTVAAG